MAGARKKRTKAKVIQFGNAPTPERLRADEWDTGAVEKGQIVRAKDAPHIMRSRIARMQRDGWVNSEEAAALAAYEMMVEKAGYGGGRSCLDMTPGGGEAGTQRMDARRRLAEVRGEFTMSDQIGALLTLDALLWPDPSHGPQTVTQVAVRLFPGRETNALKQVRRLVEIAATLLAETLGIARVARFQVVRAA